MTNKSPKLIREEIEVTNKKIGFVRDILERHSSETAGRIGAECQNAALELKALLEKNVIPIDYKVAIVGRFKAGKSSFVNELLGRKLAGEDTSPETAAVTSFRYGEKISATIRFIQRGDWERLKHLFEQDNEDIDAHRFRKWGTFSKRDTKSNGNAQTETFDLDKLEQQYVHDKGYEICIPINALPEQKGESEFRKRIKQFTSGNKPHHCLVEAIDITVPASILDEGVLLIDTPGLDDTERFRVDLTKRAVENVDAVLFLTKSGASYGQSEKDFLLTLLRKRTVKQLIFVITQIDQTYEQHVRHARDHDEVPESLTERLASERIRIEQELEKTLFELGTNDSPVMQGYREQLGEISIVFTSAANHRDSKAGDKVRYPYKAEDPGGIENIKSVLLDLLSTQSRLALTVQSISSGSRAILNNLIKIIGARRTAVLQTKTQEVAEHTLGIFRNQFRKTGEEFLRLTSRDVDLLNTDLANNAKWAKEKIENIIHEAESELGEFRASDSVRHWKTRRSGRWGYMHNFQIRIANRIFPRVQELLSDQTEQFASFVSRFNKHLESLSGSSRRISSQLELESAVSLDIASALGSFLAKVMADSGRAIDNEEHKIIALLEDFVSEEVQERIADRRELVSAVYGSGTTFAQTLEVNKFYAEVKPILKQSLLDHLNASYKKFGENLCGVAQSLPERTLIVASGELAQAEENIRAAAEFRESGQREKFEQVASEIEQSIDNVLSGLDLPLQVFVPQLSSVSIIQNIAISSDLRNVISASYDSRSIEVEQIADQHAVQVDQTEPFYEVVRISATQCLERNNLVDGQQNWSYRRIFKPELLKGSTRAILTDPYLSKFHQVRNLKDFIIAIDEATKLRELCIMTNHNSAESGPGSEADFGELATNLHKENGIQLSIVRDSTIHDRSVVFDNGVVFKMGRGLDIYKPAAGLAAHRQESRKVRSCEIDVFVIPNKA